MLLRFIKILAYISFFQRNLPFKDKRRWKNKHFLKNLIYISNIQYYKKLLILIYTFYEPLLSKNFLI